MCLFAFLLTRFGFLLSSGGGGGSDQRLFGCACAFAGAGEEQRQEEERWNGQQGIDNQANVFLLGKGVQYIAELHLGLEVTLEFGHRFRAEALRLDHESRIYDLVIELRGRLSTDTDGLLQSCPPTGAILLPNTHPSVM